LKEEKKGAKEKIFLFSFGKQKALTQKGLSNLNRATS
jgi:hypothetical protein